MQEVSVTPSKPHQPRIVSCGAAGMRREVPRRVSHVKRGHWRLHLPRAGAEFSIYNMSAEGGISRNVGYYVNNPCSHDGLQGVDARQRKLWGN